MPRGTHTPATRTTIVADIAALEVQMATVIRSVEKASVDLAELRESLAFLRGNRKAAFAWGGLLLSLLGGGVGAAVTAFLGQR